MRLDPPRRRPKMREGYDVLIQPVVTEKSTGQIEEANIVDRSLGEITHRTVENLDHVRHVLIREERRL